MPVNIPSKQPDAIKGILPLVGSVGGGAFGPVGGMIGGKIGGELGKESPAPQAIQTPVSESAMSRRLQTQEEDPSAQLDKAEAALRQLPPEYQQQYGGTIAAARKMDDQGGLP